MMVFDIRRRSVVFVAGIVFSGLGVAMATQSDLGTTPISSIPYVVTFFCPLTLGM